MLIKCTECGGSVSDKASACPHCGAPVIAEQNTSEKKTDPEITPEQNVPDKKTDPEITPGKKTAEKKKNPSDPVIRGDRIIYPEESRRDSLPPPRPRKAPDDSYPLYVIILHKLFFCIGALIVLGGIFFILLSWNPGNLREKLRETAGEEEPEQVSSARVFLKTQLLSILDAVEGRDSRKKEPARTVLPPVPKDDLPEVVEKVPNAGIGETLPPPQENP